MKYSMLREPTETWAVFDNVLQMLVEEDGIPLVGLSHEAAKVALFRLNTAVLRSQMLSARRPIGNPGQIKTR